MSKAVKEEKVEKKVANVVSVPVGISPNGDVVMEERKVFDLTDEACPAVERDEVSQEIFNTYSVNPSNKAIKAFKMTRPDLKKAIKQSSKGVRRLNNECLSPSQRILDWTRQGAWRGTIFDVAKVAAVGALGYFVLGIGNKSS